MTEKSSTAKEPHFTVAEFRRSVADVFARAHYEDRVFHVSHHGKPWVSITSHKSSADLTTLDALKDVSRAEVGAALNGLEKTFSLRELATLILETRTQRQGNKSDRNSDRHSQETQQ